MANFARCPECGAVNDGASEQCYICNAAPLLLACESCGTGVNNPVHTHCSHCGAGYRRGAGALPAVAVRAHDGKL